jgi:IS1 family transposase
MPEDESVSAITDSVEWYERHADEAVGRYESPAAERINDWFRDFFAWPARPINQARTGRLG